MINDIARFHVSIFFSSHHWCNLGSASTGWRALVGLQAVKDPYRLLNVGRDAELDVIKRAYRKLAKKLHPDQNLGNKETEQRFKDITQAYNLLSDRKARRDYDRGRINAHGQHQRQAFRPGAGSASHGSWWARGVGAMFDRVVGKFGYVARGRSALDPEQHQHQHIDVDFRTAVLGGKQRMARSEGCDLDIDIPPGTDNNTMLRLREQGGSGETGDFLVRIRVLDDPLFTRRGQDLYLDLPVSLKEALFGAKLRMPTIEGPVWLNIPAKANSGQLLRLRGKGVVDRSGKRGDQYVRLMVMLPKEPSAAMADDLERLAGYDDENVRAHLDGY